ncbi:MAG: hypothetical protein ACR2RL_23365 [Gammaproteobacteria bacterium]
MSAEPQRPGDPQAGYDALINKAYVSCGIPRPAFERVNGPVSEALKLEGRKQGSEDLPYGLNLTVTGQGVELVVSNCLICHAAMFNGELVVGLGNESLDFTRDLTEFADSFGLYLSGGAQESEWRKWADRLAALAPYMTTDTVGVNPATNLTWALMAHRDPQTLAWSSEPLIEPPPGSPLPVSVPPWWRMAKKNAMFYSTIGRGDQARHMILASLLCTDELDEAKAIDEYAPDIRAFIASIDPPRWPFDIDATLASQGEGLFASHCAHCHGTYGDTGSYPNLVIGLDEIGTDPALSRVATDGSEDRFQQWVAASYFGEISRTAPAPGYIAPPLDAVWATAPYLHNGSVPNIATLLQSERRPRYWRRASDDEITYDTRALGLRFDTLAHGKAGEPDAEQRKYIYDTDLRGYSNAGHTFGDVLSETERTALLEYLKTL